MFVRGSAIGKEINSINGMMLQLQPNTTLRNDLGKYHKNLIAFNDRFCLHALTSFVLGCVMNLLCYDLLANRLEGCADLDVEGVKQQVQAEACLFA